LLDEALLMLMKQTNLELDPGQLCGREALQAFLEGCSGDRERVYRVRLSRAP